MLASSVAVNLVLLGAMAYLYQQIPDPRDFPGSVRAYTDNSADYQPGWTQTAAARGFGPMREALLPSPVKGSGPEMLDLETGRRLTEPDFYAYFKNDGRANVAWIRTNGLDISGVVCDGGVAACICYYMAVVPVDPKRWEGAVAADILGEPELGRIHDPKRKCIALEPTLTDTYLFRTQEGTVGLLRVLGTTDDCRGVRIGYRLVVPSAGVEALAGPARGALARKAL